MTPVKFPSDFVDMPDYQSPRVTTEIEYDCRDKRYLTHKLFILVDGQQVCFRSWTEDDDWGTSDDIMPNPADMWRAWVKLTNPEGSPA